MSVASEKIEGGYGLPLDVRDVAQQLQNGIKDNKSWFGDYDIKEQ